MLHHKLLRVCVVTVKYVGSSIFNSAWHISYINLFVKLINLIIYVISFVQFSLSL